MAEVVTLPGVFRPTEDLRVEPAEVLRNAADAGLRDVVVVGRSISGEIQVWGSQPDSDATIGLMMRGLTWLSAAKQVADTQDGSG